MHSFLHDLRHACRSVVKRPVYALSTIGVLALAIAANSAVFSISSGYLLRPLPYPDDDRLVMVFNSYPKMGVPESGSSIPDYLDRRDSLPSLDDLALFAPAPVAITGDGPAIQVPAVRASASLFDVLGVAPAHGRVFEAVEATAGNERVAVLSNRLWRTRFGSRADVIDQSIRLNGVSHRVIGVMPAEFGFPDKTVDLWMPFVITPEQRSDQQRGQDFARTVGRLAKDATIETLNTELRTMADRMFETHPNMASFLETTGFTGRAELLRESIVGDLVQTALVLQALVFGVLLIASANVASLQLARIIARQQEVWIRAALGASRRRIAGLVISETCVLVVTGAVFGFALARGGLEIVRSVGIDQSAKGIDFALDARVGAFTVFVTLVAALVAALLPLAFSLSSSIATSISDTGKFAGGERGARSFRSALVVSQVAATFALLFGAGLLTKNYYMLQQQGPGFSSTGVFTARVTLPSERYANAAQRSVFLGRVLSELSAIRGIATAGFTSALPFSGVNSGATINVGDYDQLPGSPPPIAMFRSISEDYFPSLGLPVIRGRNFQASEPEHVVIVDEIFVKKFWGDENPIGKMVNRPPGEEWYTVVGVVPTLRHTSLSDRPTEGTVYWHYTQQPTTDGFLTLKTELRSLNLPQITANVVASVDSEVPVSDAMPLDTRIQRSLDPQRAPMLLTILFSTIALTLAFVGTYGVVSWTVARRFGEVGVRVALGARPIHIISMLLRESATLISFGLIAGLVCAYAVGRIVSSQIFDVSENDPMIYAAAGIIVATAALIASWLPARRASRLPAVRALRNE